MRQMSLAAVLILLPASFNLIAKAQTQQPRDQANTLVSSRADFAPPSTSDLYSSSTEGYIRTIPAPRIRELAPSQRPFHTIAFGIKANTLGAGAEFATTLSRSFNLRSGFNFLTFNHPFGVDGVNYAAQLHLRSSQTTVDWFPLHGSFHISPGILYMRNTASAVATVPAGQSFSLGDQTYLNSVSDPVNGSMSYAYPHNVCPLLMAGFGNILPRNSRHFTVPVELGVAYTGPATIHVRLTGTACNSEGCGSFADDSETQASLTQEVHDLNEDLKRIPVYPIVSVGVAYHF